MGKIELTKKFEEWWFTLSDQEQNDATAIIELLEEKGVLLPFPYSSGVEVSKFPEMRELRFQSHGHPFRVFYAFDPRRNAVLLTGGNKKGINDNRFYKKFISIADRLFEEHLKSLKVEED